MRRLIGWTVVAAIGLFVISGGAATAAKLFTGKDIKDGSVKLKDLSKRTKSVLKSVTATATPLVEATTVPLCAPTGAPPDSCQVGTSVALCPDGMVTTGGGWDSAAGSQDVSVLDNAAGNDSTGWSVLMANNGSTATSFTGFALCTPGDTPG